VPGKAKAGAGLGLPAELCEAGSGNGVDLCELLNRPGLYMPGNLVTEAIGDIIPGYPDCLPIGGDD
jgi:hypothetical protein